MAYIFDGAAKLIILSAGTTAVDLADLWSRYKEWLLVGNAGYARALDTVGGEDIDASAGTKVPLYLFLLNGWKLRPQEANHTLTVSGGTLLFAGGGDPFVDTLGNYRVRIRYSQPVQAIGYSTTGGDGATPSDIADAVWGHATAAQIAARMAEAWARLGLDASQPVTQNETQISFGAVLMALTEAGGAVTVTKQ